MIARNITRRLERLEEATEPAGEPKAWQIVTIDSAGNVEHGPGYQFEPLPRGGFRPSLGRHKSRGR